MNERVGIIEMNGCPLSRLRVTHWNVRVWALADRQLSRIRFAHRERRIVVDCGPSNGSRPLLPEDMVSNHAEPDKEA